MSAPTEVAIPLQQIGVSRRASGCIAVIGNPNAGKSTVFNRLTGMRQRTANYPGVTVERRTGRMQHAEIALDLVDLPGTYSLSPNSTDEEIAVAVLLGRVMGMQKPDAILAVLDATRLYQGLFLLQQLIGMGRPIAVALTMTDVAEQQGLQIDLEAFSARLGGLAVFPVVATTGRGFDALKRGLVALLDSPPPAPLENWAAIERAAAELAAMPQVSAAGLQRTELERLLIGGPEELERIGVPLVPEDIQAQAAVLRRELFAGSPPLASEARQRYRWVRETIAAAQTAMPQQRRRGKGLIEWLNQPWPSTLAFVLVMALVFQAVFAWATPFMELIDAGVGALAGQLESVLPAGAVTSFLADGVIAGVGSVIIFLPQILILFLFIILLEDTGYLARAAFLVDRAMRTVGLSGQSVIPLLSSFACAVPSIMATRVIPNRRDRIATILAAPFMTCSARLPIYALMIAAFVPDSRLLGPVNLQGLVLFGLYLLGIAGGVGTALLLRKTALRGKNPTFILTLPEFHVPDPRSVLVKLLDRAKVFLRRAGTVIFAVAVIVWALAYFPQSSDAESYRQQERAAAANLTGEALEQRLSDIDNEAAALQLERSLLGRAGHLIEPAFRPLGWDWRVSAAVIAGFPAREVVVAVLGTIYALGDEADEASLAARLTDARWPDGRAVFTLPMVLGLLVFYAWCLQCAATLAVIRRETNTWRWPVFAWVYMTGLGYMAALLIYQLGS